MKHHLHPRSRQPAGQPLWIAMVIVLLGWAAAGTPVTRAQDWASLREGMVAAIRADVIATRSYIGKGALRPDVLAVLARVPRHEFVPAEVRSAAYENRPLPIGFGQTISQPYIVALMTDLLEPTPGDTFLEVGTGSGYQAAVLAELVGKLYTIEIIPELARQAEERFRRLAYTNIEVRQGDGYYGWPGAETFDGIIVTAAADHVAPASCAPAKARRTDGHPRRRSLQCPAPVADHHRSPGEPANPANPARAFCSPNRRSLIRNAHDRPPAKSFDPAPPGSGGPPFGRRAGL
jgi:protein-L-isoaspartate(D-aspartate) O-methyltransferase